MIEISDKKAKWMYRVNPFQPRCLDYRENRQGMRWRRYPVNYPSTMAAIEALMALRKEAREDISGNR